MEELKPLKEPYKKKEYDSFHKGKLFRIGISEPKLSFLGAIECGPKFLNKREPEIYVKELIRNLCDKLTLSNWLSIQDGQFAIKNLNEMLQSFHLNLDNYLKMEDKLTDFESNNFNILYLRILSVLIPTSIVDEEILQPFRKFSKEFDSDDSEKIYYDLEKKYLDLYKNIIKSELDKLIKNEHLEENEDKKNKLLDILYKTTRNLFEYISYKTIDDLKHSIQDIDEWIDVYDWYYLYQHLDGKYNILLIDATTKKLWKDINQFQYLDTEKKCVVLLYFPDSNYECLFYSEPRKDLKSEYSFFNLTSKKDCTFENVRKIYSKIVRENHPDTFSDSLTELEKKEKTNYYYQIQENYKKIKEEFENSFLNDNYIKGDDFDTGLIKKGNYNEDLYFFNYKHPIIQDFLNE